MQKNSTEYAALKSCPSSKVRRALLPLSMLLCAAPSLAGDPPPLFGRYLPLHPGLYIDAGYGQDDRDRSYDQQGHERAGAAPQAGGKTSFPESRFTTRFTWHFPLFEGEDLPFLSSRTHLARVTLSHNRVRTRGTLADFAADTSDDAGTDADDLRNNGSGIGDPMFEFGSFLLGSPVAATRGGERPPYSLLLLAGLTAPFGTYDRDAPANSGGNRWVTHLQLGGHWQPRPGSILEAGFTWRRYDRNENPAFGALSPAQQGDDRVFDLSLTQLLWRGVYVGAYGTDRQGSANTYEGVRFAPNRPTPVVVLPDPTSTFSDNFPTPGRYRDGGTALREVGGSLQWFATQRLLLGLHFSQPLSGKSGQFSLPYTDRTPAGCTEGALGCAYSPGTTVLVDGLGPARSYASPRWTLSLAWQFGLGDLYPCAGCQR